MIHELKILPEYFAEVASGSKTFELRRNDRQFRVGDVLRLCEYEPECGRYTGNRVDAVVTSLLPGGRFDLPDHLCVMSIRVIRQPPGPAAPAAIIKPFNQ
jgi:ParB family chromosome partitioning protein